MPADEDDDSSGSMLGAGAAGAVLGGAAELLSFGIPNYPGAAKSVVTFCGLGATTGLVFWLVAFAGLRSNNRWRGP